MSIPIEGTDLFDTSRCKSVLSIQVRNRRYYRLVEEYTLEALGQVVRQHREAKGLTQEELGTAAGYSQASAGVSISRLEGGNLAPRVERMVAIARELDVSWDSLQSQAAMHSRATGNGESQMDRIRRAVVQRDELARKHALLLDTRGRAATEFLEPLRDFAARIRGADLSRANGPDLAPTADEVRAEVAYQFKFTRDGLQRALAEVDERADFGNFAETIALGVATAATLEAALPSPAARRGFLAAMGLAARPRLAPGGVLLGAVAIGVAAAALVDRQQSRRARRRTESTARIAEAEADLARTQPNVDALHDVISRATEIFEYVATHAAHALTRLRDQVGAGPLAWETLSDDQQHRYSDFVEIAAAFLAVATIDLQELAGSADNELDRATALANQVLLHATRTITSRV